MKANFKKRNVMHEDTGEVWSEIWYLYLDNKKTEYYICAPGYAMYKDWVPNSKIDYYVYHEGRVGCEYENLYDAKIALLEAVARGWTKDKYYFYLKPPYMSSILSKSLL